MNLFSNGLKVTFFDLIIQRESFLVVAWLECFLKEGLSLPNELE
jgi:hypothetical protein